MACPITVKLACQFPPPPLLSQHPHPSNIPFISWVVSCSIEHRQLCVCVCMCVHVSAVAHSVERLGRGCPTAAQSLWVKCDMARPAVEKGSRCECVCMCVFVLPLFVYAQRSHSRACGVTEACTHCCYWMSQVTKHTRTRTLTHKRCSTIQKLFIAEIIVMIIAAKRKAIKIN